VHHHLAPPLWARKNEKGELQKTPFGPWVRRAFRVLAPLRALRGSALDVFGYSDERKVERALIQEYRDAIAAMLNTLTADNHDAAIAFAKLPEQIRGFGHVKARHIALARVQWAALLNQYHQTLAKAA
jgi:indolepyruvate ferredoxin oxidoreductase